MIAHRMRGVLRQARAILTLLIACLLSSCSILKLPAVCDLGPFEMREASADSLVRSDTVNFVNETIAGFSARRLKEADAERIGQLVTWQSTFARCPKAEEPVPMHSAHKLARLVLERTGSSQEPTAIALTNSCWRRKFRLTEDLFVDDKSAPLFCDSLDPELVLDTTKRQQEDAETLKKMREEGDSLALWLLGPLLSDQRLYAYRYMERVLPAIAIAVKNELIQKLPEASQPAAKALKLEIVYDTDVLFAKVPSSKDKLLVSAPVLRAAYAGALQSVLPELEALRTEFFQVRGNPEQLEKFRDKAIDATQDIARRIWLFYRESLAFTLAHEMAHAYAARGSAELSSENVADCYAVANLIDWSSSKSSAGMFNLLVADAIRPTGGVWVSSALSESETTVLVQRKVRVAELLERGRRTGTNSLRASCAA